MSLIKLGKIPFYSLNIKQTELQRLPSFEKALDEFGEKKQLIESFCGNGEIEELGIESSIILSLDDEAIDQRLSQNQHEVLNRLYMDVFLELTKRTKDLFSFYYFLSPEVSVKSYFDQLQQRGNIVSTLIDDSFSTNIQIDESATASIKLFDEEIPETRFPIGNLTSNINNKSHSFYIGLKN